MRVRGSHFFIASTSSVLLPSHASAQRVSSPPPAAGKQRWKWPGREREPLMGSAAWIPPPCPKPADGACGGSQPIWIFRRFFAEQLSIEMRSPANTREKPGVTRSPLPFFQTARPSATISTPFSIRPQTTLLPHNHSPSFHDAAPRQRPSSGRTKALGTEAPSCPPSTRSCLMSDHPLVTRFPPISIGPDAHKKPTTHKWTHLYIVRFADRHSGVRVESSPRPTKPRLAKKVPSAVLSAFLWLQPDLARTTRHRQASPQHPGMLRHPSTLRLCLWLRCILPEGSRPGALQETRHQGRKEDGRLHHGRHAPTALAFAQHGAASKTLLDVQQAPGGLGIGLIQPVGAKIWYNPYITLEDELVKYGVISVDDLCTDLLDWRDPLCQWSDAQAGGARHLGRPCASGPASQPCLGLAHRPPSLARPVLRGRAVYAHRIAQLHRRLPHVGAWRRKLEQGAQHRAQPAPRVPTPLRRPHAQLGHSLGRRGRTKSLQHPSG